jgi:hypothetical protein
MADDSAEAEGCKHPSDKEQPDGSADEDQATEEEHLQRPRHRTLLSHREPASIHRVIVRFLRTGMAFRLVRNG